MYSSPKFFVPSVIVGLAAAAGFFLPPPQATRPMRSATPKETANAAFAARRVCFRTILSPPLRVTSVQTLRSRSRPARDRASCNTQRERRQQRDRRDAESRREHA